MRIILTIILLIVSTLTFAQVDTIDYRPHNSIITESPKKVDSKTIKSKRKNQKSKYTVEEKKSDNNEYEQVSKESKTIDDCKPCWLRYYGQDGKLLQEGLSYSDCALGKNTEYYPSGKIKVVRFYKTNNTTDWTKFPCSVAEGTWIYYKEDGTVEKTQTFIDGVQIK